MTWRTEILHTASFAECLNCVKILAFFVQSFLSYLQKSENLNSSARKSAE